MRQDRSRRALSSVEQEGGWPSQIGTWPSRFLKRLNLCGFAVVVLQDSAELASATNLVPPENSYIVQHNDLEHSRSIGAMA